MDRRTWMRQAGMLVAAGSLTPSLFSQSGTDVEVRIDADRKLGAFPQRGLGFSMEKKLIGMGDLFVTGVKALWLTAPKMDATGNLELGGAPIGTDGWFQPVLQSLSSTPNGQFTISVPPASAVCVKAA